MTDYAKARELGEQAREKEWTRPSFAKQLFLGDFRLTARKQFSALNRGHHVGQ